MAENDKTIVSRIQHRRGLKQDLPQPLRPGEIGLATDSRQVYMGGDPDNPLSAPYNAVSYFENTLGAKDHVVSIANNQIIAFTVPFLKYSKGEYNGITTVKSWQPTDARSVISSLDLKNRFHSADYDVFNTKITTNIVTTVDSSTTGSALAYVTSTAASDSDTLGNIRVGDRVTGNTVPENVCVSSVERDVTGIKVTLTSAQSLTAGEHITFIPQVALNFSNYASTPSLTFLGNQTKFLQGSFKSTDVSVHKNGIKLVPEANAEILNVPTATADYTFDASNVSPTGSHILTLRTRPTPNDDITVCYYSNANVLQAIEGISNGKVSPGSSVNSFYTAYNIPEYRQIPKENIRVSETTGVGFIGLQQKHIHATHDGANISSPDTLSGMGHLLVSRMDNEQALTNITVNGSSSLTNTLYDVNFVASTDADMYSIVGDSGIYRYNRVYLESTTSTDYFHDKVFDIITAAGGGSITLQVPNTDYQITRSATANIAPISVYSGNGFTDTTPSQTIIRIIGDSEGISTNDYVRIIADTAATGSDPANCELHDTIFKVNSSTATYFDLNIDTGNVAGNTIPNFTSNISGVKFVNHGSNVSNVNSTFQMSAPRHGLTTSTANIQFVSEDNPIGSADWRSGDYGTLDISRITSNTVVLTGVSYSPISGNVFSGAGSSEYTPGLSGTFRPVLNSSYSTIDAVPVLAIDLSGNSTVKDVITTVNKPKVETKSGGTEHIIFPLLDYLPKTDGTKNQLYLSTKSSYSSVAVGGVEFGVFNDTSNTASKLGLTQGVYTRQNNSVKAKLEQWMNSLVNNREVNLFSNILSGGSLYASLTPNHFNDYIMTIDGTFGEVLFGSRQEASDFNYIVNSAYSESKFDRSEDNQEGTRGLINLKNNLEIQTRESASQGEKITTYTSLEGASILQSNDHTNTVFTLDASRYNSFKLDYTMVESPVGGSNKYMRIGSMDITIRSDYADPGNAVILNDTFSSHWEVSHSDPVVEPKFTAEVNGSTVNIKMEQQFRTPDNPNPLDKVVHTLDTGLKFKYIYSRWSSTD